ncbi:MAG: hypothetical protein QM803_02465 [Rhodocyclaceae bacterium]
MLRPTGTLGVLDEELELLDVPVELDMLEVLDVLDVVLLVELLELVMLDADDVLDAVDELVLDVLLRDDDDVLVDVLELLLAMLLFEPDGESPPPPPQAVRTASRVDAASAFAQRDAYCMMLSPPWCLKAPWRRSSVPRRRPCATCLCERDRPASGSPAGLLGTVSGKPALRRAFESPYGWDLRREKRARHAFRAVS